MMNTLTAPAVDIEQEYQDLIVREDRLHKRQRELIEAGQVELDRRALAEKKRRQPRQRKHFDPLPRQWYGQMRAEMHEQYAAPVEQIEQQIEQVQSRRIELAPLIEMTASDVMHSLHRAEPHYSAGMSASGHAQRDARERHKELMDHCPHLQAQVRQIEIAKPVSPWAAYCYELHADLEPWRYEAHRIARAMKVIDFLNEGLPLEQQVLRNSRWIFMIV
jgi:hypothetical protein